MKGSGEECVRCRCVGVSVYENISLREYQCIRVSVYESISV